VPQLRIALCQVNATVGDLDGNAELVLRWTRHAAQQGAHIVAFPEMFLTGYPIEDLALRRSFLAASQATVGRLAERLAAEGLGHLLVVVGYVDGVPADEPRVGRPAGSPQNAAAVLHEGRQVARYAKHHLPNYGVFDEARHFVPGQSLAVLRVHGVDVAITICEDLWQDGGPVAVAREAGAGLLLVINASPYERNKDDVRLELVAGAPPRRAARWPMSISSAGRTSWSSTATRSSCRPTARSWRGHRSSRRGASWLTSRSRRPKRHWRASGWRVDGSTIHVERVVVSDQPLEPYVPIATGIAPRLPDEAEVYSALVEGLRDYVRKNGFRTVVFGLSGGIDSALTAAVAVDALGAEAVHGVSMPSAYSSEHSMADAADLAARTGLRYSTIPIAPMVDAFLRSIELTGLAEENSRRGSAA
jgi:NAD+ synthase (glutamine-hydrolysing)